MYVSWLEHSVFTMGSSSLLLATALACLGLVSADCGRDSRGDLDAIPVTLQRVEYSARYYNIETHSELVCREYVPYSHVVGLLVTVCSEPDSMPTPVVTVTSLSTASVIAFSNTMIDVVVYCGRNNLHSEQTVIQAASRGSLIPLGAERVTAVVRGGGHPLLPSLARNYGKK